MLDAAIDEFISIDACRSDRSYHDVRIPGDFVVPRIHDVDRALTAGIDREIQSASLQGEQYFLRRSGIHSYRYDDRIYAWNAYRDCVISSFEARIQSDLYFSVLDDEIIGLREYRLSLGAIILYESIGLDRPRFHQSFSAYDVGYRRQLIGILVFDGDDEFRDGSGIDLCDIVGIHVLDVRFILRQIHRYSCQCLIAISTQHFDEALSDDDLRLNYFRDYRRLIDQQFLCCHILCYGYRHRLIAFKSCRRLIDEYLVEEIIEFDAIVGCRSIIELSISAIHADGIRLYILSYLIVMAISRYDP